MTHDFFFRTMFRHEAAENAVKALNEAAPYLSYAARFTSFKAFKYDKRFTSKCSSDAVIINRNSQIHTIFKLAHAGFYSTATPTSPTNAKCPFCMLELTFAENDDPWEKHRTQKPDCEFVILGQPDETTLTLQIISSLAIRCATVAEYEKMLPIIHYLEEADHEQSYRREEATRKLISLRNNSQYLTADHRYATFKIDGHRAKGVRDHILKKIAKAGWCSAITNRSLLSAKCPFCLLTIDFDTTDDFWEEHKNSSANCDFVKLNKLNEKDWTTEEALMLAVKISVVKKFEKQRKILEQLENDKEADQLANQLSKMMARPKCLRRRCSV
ncbi:CRE-BIR-2 protein [Caenorhabditis remanei]|uniref:CRE-BIR-2 protein n=1 Tax=Caenorhabditis remanei TaxID=31234 RepID=E3M088_CAERE|nr:CRE-BIR-2 protein [Caenorhabditis remanei]